MRRYVLLAMLAAGCRPGVTPGQVALVSLETVGCIFTHVGDCLAQDTPWLTCAANTATACGSDVQTVTTLWGEHVKQEVREGFVPKVPQGFRP